MQNGSPIQAGVSVSGWIPILSFFERFSMNMNDIISCHEVPEAERMAFVNKLFGSHFPLCLERTMFNMAGRLAAQYHGGYWAFYALSNGGFWMAPRGDAIFEVCCENDFEGTLS